MSHLTFEKSWQKKANHPLLFAKETLLHTIDDTIVIMHPQHHTHQVSHMRS